MFIADVNPKYNSSMFVICDGSRLYNLQAMVLPHLSVPCQPPWSCSHLLGAIGVFFPAGGQNLKENSLCLCHLSSSMAEASKGRPDNHFYQPPRKSSLCLLGTFCDFQRPFSHLDLSEAVWDIITMIHRFLINNVVSLNSQCLWYLWKKFHLFSLGEYGGGEMHVYTEIRG